MLLDLATRFANDVDDSSCNHLSRPGRYAKGRPSDREDGDDAELETASLRNNRARRCHRAGLDHGGHVRPRRSPMVVGRRDHRRRHRRIAGLDDRQEVEAPERGQRRRDVGSPVRRSLHRPSTPRRMASAPAAPSARVDRLAGSSGTLARPSSAPPPTPVACPANSPAALVRASATAPAPPVAWPAGSSAAPARASPAAQAPPPAQPAGLRAAPLRAS